MFMKRPMFLFEEKKVKEVKVELRRETVSDAVSEDTQTGRGWKENKIRTYGNTKVSGGS